MLDSTTALLFVFFCAFQSLSENQDQIKDKKKASKTQSANAAAKVFSRYDVVETSYHFYSDRIDLHLCDDPGGSKYPFFNNYECLDFQILHYHFRLLNLEMSAHLNYVLVESLDLRLFLNIGPIYWKFGTGSSPT